MNHYNGPAEASIWRVSAVATYLLMFLLAAMVARAEIVITEIHFDPADGEGVPQPELEFVEIFNDGSEPYDLSGYRFTRGISFVFPEGTFIGDGDYLVVCRDQGAVQARYGISGTLGNFIGTLDNSGETIELANPQGLGVSTVTYNDRGQWPGGAKGTGHTLAIKRPYSDSDDPDNWKLSAEMGGTPGRSNFNTETSFVDSVIIPDNATWSFFRGESNPPATWRELDFNDAAWESGPTGIGYGDGDDRTELNDMRNNYVSVFCRKIFEIENPAELDSVILSVSFDDGFVVYLNSQEVGRVNMPGGNINNTTESDGTVGDAPAEADAEISIPTGALNAGRNVLAVSVHNTSPSSSDLSFVPTLVSRRKILPEELATVPVLVNEGHFLPTQGARFVELYNKSFSSLDLGGFHLSDDFSNLSAFTIPDGTIIPARGFVSFTEAQLGLDLAIVEGVRERVSIALTNPSATRIVDARIFEPKVPGRSEARYPDGQESFARAALPTPGEANETGVVRDVIFNEIMYNPISGLDLDEFVEFFNRGDGAHDISGWKVEGVGDFEFPPGTVIGPGEYLVIAHSVSEIARDHGLGPDVLVQTPYPGNLGNGGERLRLRDLNGNIADKVRYYDGGQWSRWADGGGSSLERIDPDSESSVATSWDASDDSDESEVNTYTHTAQHGGGESDLGLLLPAEGITLVDNIQLTRSNGGSNMVSNGTFNSNTSGWRIEGTHITSGRTTNSDEVIAGNGSLKLIAWNGGGDYKVNRIETNTSSQSNGTTYRITFNAKWKIGSATLLCIGDYNVGNPSSPGIAGSHLLAVPLTLGSPGAVNSVTRRQQERFGSSNMGPAIDQVSQDPAVPAGGESVTVTARVRDPDGVDEVRLFYRTNSVSGAYSSVTMREGDKPGKYSGTIPAQSNGTRVIYYIEADDDRGRSERFPFDLLERSHAPVVNPASAGRTEELFNLYRHDTRNPSTNHHNYRFVMAEEHENELRNRRVLSNKMLDGSFIFGGDDIYYGSRIRFAGSPWLRPGGGGFEKSFSLKIPKDKPLHGRKTAFNLDEHASDGKERLAHYLMRRNAASTRLPYFDFQSLVRFQLNDVRTGTYEALDKPNRQYINFWFPEGGESFGAHFEMDDRFGFNDSGSRTGNAEGRALFPPYGSTGGGNNKENYRWYFSLRNRKTEDDYTPLIGLCRLLDSRTTSSSAFDNSVFSIIDVEEMLRVLAIVTNIDHWDTWGGRRGKNCYFYRAPSDGLWRLVPWDLELTFGNAGGGEFSTIPSSPTGTIPNHFSEVTRMLNRPRLKRMYYGILKGMIDDFFYTGGNSPLSAYISRISAAGVGSTGGVSSFVNSRNSYLRDRVNAACYPAVRLRITTNGGRDITHEGAEPFIDIDGESPADVFVLSVSRNGEFLDEADFEFSNGDMRDWSIDDIPLVAGANELEILGFNASGEIVDTDSITVTSTAGWDRPIITTAQPNPIGQGEILTVSGRDFHEGVVAVLRGGGDVRETDIDFDPDNPGTATLVIPDNLDPGIATVEVRNIDGQISNQWSISVLPPAPQFIRGDSNLDGSVNISDGVKIVRHLFAGVQVDCQDALDANDDGNINLTDAVYVLDFLYRAGAAPSAPYPLRGRDVSDVDALGCDQGL